MDGPPAAKAGTHPSEWVDDLFRIVVEQNVDSHLMIDGDGHIVYANAAANQLLTSDGRPLEGRQFGFPLVSGESTEIDINRPDGQTAVAEMRAQQVQLGGRKAYLVSIRDITTRRDMERERDQALRQIEHMEQGKRLAKLWADFINQVAHELQTPMTPILLEIRLLERLGDLNETQRQRMTILERNIARLQAIIERLVRVRELAFERENVTPQVVTDLSQVALRVVRRSERAALARDVQVVVHQAAGLEVAGQPRRLEDALHYLVENAVRFSARGASVHVRCHQDPIHAFVSVEDAGLGFPEDEKDVLFRPFGRPAGHEGLEGSGAGLGLFLCRQIVEDAHGVVWASSPGPGKGATFTIALPRLTAPPGRGDRGEA